MTHNKKTFVIIILFSFLTSCLFAQPKTPRDMNENFSLSAFTKTIDNSDSLKVLIYMQIPYSSLQFIKYDSLFIAKYEATIALQTKNGTQLFREIWQDSIVVDDYSYTESLTISRTLMMTSTIKAGKYKVIGNLLDLDTKKNRKSNIKFDVSKYDENIFINPPILLEPFDGEWGFGENLIPAIKNWAFNMDEGLSFYLSGKVSNGEYTIENTFRNHKGKVFHVDVIEDSSDTGIFEHIVTLPSDSIRGISIKLESEIVQGKKSMEQSRVFALRKVGISHMIEDINTALDQMSYILTSKERRMVRKTTTFKREELFKKLWKERDPTPDTEKNELMDEYYSRVEYANMQFESHIDGWRTDMGMIYIRYGPPDEIQKYVDQYQTNYEIWYYNRIDEYYTFISDIFGNYTLKNRYLNY